MANRKQVALLKQGVEAWNAWRRAHPKIRPNLFRADLTRASLSGADLRRTNLGRASLRYADLCGAQLGGADLVWGLLCQALHRFLFPFPGWMRPGLDA